MRILITGGNGFLGSSFVKKLVQEQHSLYVFSKNTNNLIDVLPFIDFDYAHTEDLMLFQDKIKSFSPEIVIHFGWSGGNNYIDVNQTNQFYENIPPGIKLIEFLNTLPQKPKFIGVGSFSEYGRIDYQVNEETYENPINLYGLSKLTFKNYSKTLCDNYGIDWVWIRPCYIYGPNDVSTRLIPMLVNKFMNNEDIELDPCDKIIDYLYIEDFVNFVYSLIMSSSTGVYNVCSGEQYELKDIIKKIHFLLGSKSEIYYNFNLNRKLTSSYICGDNNKIISSTNLTPKIDLETGILKTINFYKNKK